MVPFVIVRLILGATLLTTAALKSYQLATEPVDGGSLLSSRWLLVLAVEIEFAMAAWLLTGFAPGGLRWAAMVFFCALGGVALAKAWAGEASCGCLGRWTISPWAAVAFDAGAVAALYGTSRRNWIVDCGHARRWPGAVACALTAIVAFPSGVAMARYEPARLGDDGHVVGVGRHAVLQPDGWVGRPFPLREYVEIAGDLDAGAINASRWIVLLVRPDCPLCEEAVTRYRRIAAELGKQANAGRPAPRLAVISLPGDSIADGRLPDGAADGLAMVGHLSGRFVWHVTTPAEMTLREGIVMRVRTRASPSAEDFANL